MSLAEGTVSKRSESSIQNIHHNIVVRYSSYYRLVTMSCVHLCIKTHFLCLASLLVGTMSPCFRPAPYPSSASFFIWLQALGPLCKHRDHAALCILGYCPLYLKFTPH